jgi:hypothetical protein
MDAYTELDATLGGQSGIALDHRRLHLDSAAHSIDNAPELDERAVSRPLDDTSAVHGDGRIDEIAAERPEPGQSAVFIGPGKPAVPDHIRRQDCSEFPLLGHCPPHFLRRRYYHVAEPRGEFPGEAIDIWLTLIEFSAESASGPLRVIFDLSSARQRLSAVHLKADIHLHRNI